MRPRPLPSVRRTGGLALALWACALPAAPAALAGDPIMPLSEVRPGMRCEARSVVRGTEISTFDAEVIDVVGSSSGDVPRILVRVSGPVVDESGIGFGFSGSPLYCPDGGGAKRNAGAIAATTGDYGNKLALVTPIEHVLAQSTEPPGPAAAARPAGAVSTPLVVTGLPRAAMAPVAALARRAGRTLLAVPDSPTSGFPRQQLAPGSSMATGLSAGDLTVGSIGTVTYTDGDRVWAFGHALDGAGRRSLFLQDSYVYTVVPNPLLNSYKLAAPGHTLGVLSGDGPTAVAGLVGAEPPSFPLKVVGRDLDTGRVTSSESVVASEFGLGDPSGASPLRLVGGLAIAGSGIGVLGGSPSRESGVMCMRVELEGLEKPLRVCNRYVGRGFVLTVEGSGVPVPVGRMLADFSRAMDLLEGYEFGAIRVKGVEVSVKMRRGLAGAQIVGVRAPGRARRGSRIRVRLLLRRAGGGRASVTFRLRVPRSLERGLQPLTITGPELNESDAAQSELIFATSEEEGAAEPTSLPELAEAFGALRRYDGVRAAFGGAETPDDPGDLGSILEDLLGGGETTGRPAYRHPTLRIAGSGVTAIRIR